MAKAVDKQGDSQNLIRTVADVVNIDHWIEHTDTDISIHIDVVFRSAPVGGAAADTVSFRMELRRAELVVLLPKSEGLSIIPNSISRNRVERSVETSVQQTNNKNSSASVDLKARVTALSFIPGFAANFSNQNSKSSSQSISEVMRGNGIDVQHRRSSDGHYRWEMFPTNGKTLSGSGWDASTEPRFRIVKPAYSRLERNIIIQIRCLREDMYITDIKIIKNDGTNFTFGTSDRNKVAAAEAYIKTKLAESGLVSGDISNRFAEICLLETVISI